MTTTPEQAREQAKALDIIADVTADGWFIEDPKEAFAAFGRELHQAARALEDLAGQVEAWQKYDSPETW